MTESTRPKRVVMVDADDPLTEVEGEFFWREDHERAVAAAYHEGYQAGVRDAAQQPQQVVVWRRGVGLKRLLLGGFLLFVVVSYLVTLIGSWLR